MTADNNAPSGSANGELTGLQIKPSHPTIIETWMNRRSQKDRRNGQDRRKRQEPINIPDQRSERDRRKDDRRSKALRIPIFIKLATLSTLLIFIVIATISLSMLARQKKQFAAQLINLGESLVRVIASNAGDKLLGDEDLALFQLVDDIARNDQVIYALIVDKKNTIKAHSRIDAVNKLFISPNSTRDVKRENDVITRMIVHAGAEALFFEKPIIYQKLKVGTVYLSISQVKVLQNIRKAKGFLWMLTGIITVLGILLSLVLSMYFSRPIRILSEGTKALALGNFDNRVCIKRNDEFGDLAISFNRMAEDLKLTETIKNSFGRYVTPEIVERIIANPDNQWMKGSKVDVSVLFVDIRGFASLSENKDPQRIVEMLNDYFTCVYDAVINYGGHINKFVGDEAMVIFGAPASNPRHAEDAVRAGLEIQKEILKLNRVKRTGIENIHVGVGINSGEMVAGNLGSPMRMEYTVIGDNVNIASRLTSLAKAGEILISSSTHDLIKDTGGFQAKNRGRVSVKGREKKVGVFNIIALNEDQDHDGTQNKEY